MCATLPQGRRGEVPLLHLQAGGEGLRLVVGDGPGLVGLDEFEHPDEGHEQEEGASCLQGYDDGHDDHLEVHLSEDQLVPLLEFLLLPVVLGMP